MTDRFSIVQFTIDKNATASSKPWLTLRTGQFSAVRHYDCTGTVTTDQKEKRKSPRLAFLKIPARPAGQPAHIAHICKAARATPQAKLCKRVQFCQCARNQ